MSKFFKIFIMPAKSRLINGWCSKCQNPDLKKGKPKNTDMSFHTAGSVQYLWSLWITNCGFESVGNLFVFFN